MSLDVAQTFEGPAPLLHRFWNSDASRRPGDDKWGAGNAMLSR